MEWGGQIVAGLSVPNWRERLVCPGCRMNNRQRLVAVLTAESIQSDPAANIYFMEYTTSIYKWVVRSFKKSRIFGSEYLGYQYKSGETVNGIPHEDVMKLSFADGSIDLIVSNDVLEHVPDPWCALRECARVLSPSGVLLATFPFHSAMNQSVIRAELCEGAVKNIHPPLFHGNPVSREGSLVFTDFGWDILDHASAAGFADVVLDIYASKELGHLGGGQVIFRMAKTVVKEIKLPSRQNMDVHNPPTRSWLDRAKDFLGV